MLRIISLLLLAVPAWPADLIGYHEPRLDSGGHILPWYGTGPSQAYDHIVRTIWPFWRNMRNCPNGVPLYLQHQVWKGAEEDPRGLGGDQINMALSSWNLLHGYLGDPSLKTNMAMMADFWLKNGMSGPNDLWANLPYPYNTELHSGRYDGDMRAGKGFLQPDKAGSFGAELIMLYKQTGDAKYVDAAAKIADSLVAHVQSGDATHSPWPYRVHAQTGEVHQAKTKAGDPISAAYTSNWTPTLRLLEGLIQLKRGDVARYAKCARMVQDWLKAYPLKSNKWGPFFEDISTSDYSDTEINADTMGMWILEHPTWDDAWKQQARGILQWSYETFANHEFEKWGVTPINEQTVYKVPGNSHTSRHASVELLYCEKTGDCATKQAAIHRLNWATYMVDNDGKNRYPRDDIWLTDGYGDYVRHYLRAMASAPELVPEDQNHLLRTSSVIRSIDYSPTTIAYTKFDPASEERFKIGQGRPKSVTGGKMTWDPSSKVLLVKSIAPSVSITLE
jgi:hypothetical protein